ncbi:bifunctional diguanylate cyclase/phosphodiesterase [Brevundimonas sp.]|uniref:putative bifunctional diguanylate cyclase/phosphodiesterase n=1 Tax=Brevundimonas sp. TaxID=1871086 RepID=UPI001A28525A|nr:bifunctional diguanylate cyclase/phosphodiesterase [Brevundimonas sp.]MBJ7485861.1 bifunctional diguanylate cyclase/phosphodiesterase [Brevundimonas sp.]
MTTRSPDALMRNVAGHTMDVLTFAALLTLASLVIFLVLQASAIPTLASSMPTINAGLIASALLLLRQWKKGRDAESAARAGASHLRRRDPVTQLPNAEGFVEALGHQASTQPRVAVVCVSLDRLRDVYDRLGTACGDEVLRELGVRLCSALGQSGAVARIGDDTLALFHPSSSEIKLALVGGQIGKLMSLPVATPAGEVVVGATIGVNFCDLSVTDPREALRQARLACSAARTAGGDLAFFDASLDEAQRLKLDLEMELRQALADGVLRMVYQPQIDERGVTIGVEALMRWPHPTRGAIPPSLFVPLAEAAGLGEALGRYAMDHAFADSVLWPNLKVAINVSPIQLQSTGFITTVRDLLKKHDVKPQAFEFEITEGLLLEAGTTVLGNLEHLRKLGFQIALDDFGTGYSSLSYLGQFPIDKIKIDRSFVTPLGVREDAASIIRAISDLSGAIGVKVLAEGVETRVQLDMLRAEGCNQAQGYFVAPPMARAQILQHFGQVETTVRERRLRAA